MQCRPGAETTQPGHQQGPVAQRIRALITWTGFGSAAMEQESYGEAARAARRPASLLAAGAATRRNFHHDLLDGVAV